MRKFVYGLVFVLGFFSCALVSFVFDYSEVEVPFRTGFVLYDVSAPSDWVSEDDIVVMDDVVILKIANVSLSSYADSGSMKPLFDKGANGIRIVPGNEDDIEVGDIVSYRLGAILVVHRVVEKGVDKDGVYFVMKGDNNVLSDGKVRFSDIEYVTVGVIF